MMFPDDIDDDVNKVFPKLVVRKLLEDKGRCGLFRRGNDRGSVFRLNVTKSRIVNAKAFAGIADGSVNKFKNLGAHVSRRGIKIDRAFRVSRNADGLSDFV
jgi:hypothetical protein